MIKMKIFLKPRSLDSESRETYRGYDYPCHMILLANMFSLPGGVAYRASANIMRAPASIENPKRMRGFYTSTSAYAPITLYKAYAGSYILIPYGDTVSILLHHMMHIREYISVTLQNSVRRAYSRIVCRYTYFVERERMRAHMERRRKSSKK